jgi:hypothetical protein
VARLGVRLHAKEAHVLDARTLKPFEIHLVVDVLAGQKVHANEINQYENNWKNKQTKYQTK